MQTQEKETTSVTKSTLKSRRTRWLTGLSILIGVALLAGIGATALAYSHTTSSSVTITKTSTWQRVLNGYALVSLTAAPNNASIVYACGTSLSISTPTSSSPKQPMSSYILLRSTDSGTTWQRVTNNIANCQLVINPAQSDDIYVVGPAAHIASNGEVSNVLKHSTDGGLSWTDIAPTIETGNPQLSIVWNVQQLTMVGNRLFGIQEIPSARVSPIRPIGKPSPVGIVTRLDLTRLVESSNGGHTWSIVDGNFAATGQSVYGYAVSPSDAQTIYELVGAQDFPYGTPIIPGDAPIAGKNLTLYKTTNGGRTWTKLRENVQYGSTIQLAANDASLVFVGSSVGRLSPIGPDVPPTARYFSLVVSKDGGTTWNAIKQPDNASLTPNWFVGSDDQVYLATGAVVTGQPTRPIHPDGSIVSGSPGVSIGDVTTIQRYNVTTDSWSTMTKTPASGTLLAVTGNATTHTSTMWFLSDTQKLYRETL